FADDPANGRQESSMDNSLCCDIECPRVRSKHGEWSLFTTCTNIRAQSACFAIHSVDYIRLTRGGDGQRTALERRGESLPRWTYISPVIGRVCHVGGTAE